MPTFHVLAAVFALVVLVRNGLAAWRLLRARPVEEPADRPAGPGRLAVAVPLLACLAAAAVLAVAVKAMLAALAHPGATP